MTSSVSTRFLDGRHAIVTGGSRGIGAAIAAELARLGAAVTIMGRHLAALERQAAAISRDEGSSVTAEQCDVSDDASVARAFARALEASGDAYVLVNNAGQGESSPFAELKPDAWARILDVNLTGTYRCSQQVIGGMLAARAGRIVNIASTAGLRGYGRMSAYCAAKHGVVGLTRALAMETARHGITVNAVCPGYTETDMSEQAIESLMTGRGIGRDEALGMLLRNIPRGRLTQPDEVASLVGWLCSPDAAAVTGQALPVSGGEVA